MVASEHEHTSAVSVSSSPSTYRSTNAMRASVSTRQGGIHVADSFGQLGVVGRMHRHVGHVLQPDEPANRPFAQFVAGGTDRDAHDEAAQRAGVSQRGATPQHGQERVLRQVVDVSRVSQGPQQDPPDYRRVLVHQPGHRGRTPFEDALHELGIAGRRNTQGNQPAGGGWLRGGESDAALGVRLHGGPFGSVPCFAQRLISAEGMLRAMAPIASRVVARLVPRHHRTTLASMPRRAGERPSSPDQDPVKLWLHDRLTGNRAREEWRAIVEAAWEQLLAARVEQVIPRDKLVALVESHLTQERVLDLIRPVVRAMLPTLVERMRADDRPLSRWVPDSARDGIRRMVSRPGLVDPEWVRALFRQEAVEALMADALYRGIRDFSTIMPRLLLGLLPGSRLPGMGGAGALGKRLLDELEQRIEPEIKAFLAGGTQRALRHAADFAVRHLDDRPSISLRTNMVDFVLSKSPSFHAQALREELLADVEPVAEAIGRSIAELPESRQIAREIVDKLATRHAQRPVADVLLELGVTGRPDFDAWADATWPAVRTYLSAPAIVAWIDGIVDELVERQKLARRKRRRTSNSETTKAPRKAT